MATLKETNESKMKGNKKDRKDLKKKLESLGEQVQIYGDGWPTAVAQYKQEYDQYHSKRKEKERKMEEHKSKKKQRNKFVLLDDSSPSPQRKVMNWDLGFGYEDSQSEGDFHSLKSDQRTKSKGIKKQNVSRESKSGRRIRGNPGPPSSDSSSSSSSSSSGDDDDDDDPSSGRGRGEKKKNKLGLSCAKLSTT